MAARLLRLAVVVVTAAGMGLPSATALSTHDWQRRIADRADGVAADDHGGVYVAATTGTSRRPSVVIVAAYGPSGGLRWTRRWSPVNAWTSGRDVAVGPDGSVYLAGGVGVEGYEGGSWFLARYTSEGRLLWRRATPGWRHLRAVGVTSVAVEAGMVVIGGYGFGCCSEANDEGFVRAYTFDGELLWHHEVQGPGRLAGHHDGVGDVAVGAKGSVYLTGWVETRNRTTEDVPTDIEILVQKLSPEGAEIWSRVLWDHHGRDRDRGVAIAARGNELVVLAYPGSGRWVESRGPDVGHAWLGRYTFDGRARWTRTWGTRPRGAAQPESLAIGDDGTIYVVGASRDPSDVGLDAFARAYSPCGRLVWKRFLGDAPSLRATDVDVEGSTLAASGIEIREILEPSGGYVWRIGLR